jgi:hypothetical protein
MATIAFLGDLALIGRYDLLVNKNVLLRLGALKDELSEYDFVVGNLESPITTIQKSLIPKSMHLRTDPINIKVLKYLGVDAVSLANNHANDFGSKGMKDTIKYLEDSGIEWFGANGKSLLTHIKGQLLSFSGYCCYSTNGTGYLNKISKRGIHPLRYNDILAQLEEDRIAGAFSVFSIHWGDEHTPFPKYEHIILSEKLASQKDVLIAGHHPHIVQGVRKVKDSLIAYSLGNCLFDEFRSINGKFMMRQNIDNNISFILGVEITDSSIIQYDIDGYKDGSGSIEMIDISNEISAISKEITSIKNVDEYNSRRKSQIQKVLVEKFGRHDISWLISRLNYYSVAAFILGKLRRLVYSRETKKYVDQ